MLWADNFKNIPLMWSLLCWQNQLFVSENCKNTNMYFSELVVITLGELGSFLDTSFIPLAIFMALCLNIGTRINL